jgi:hypothetical protein
MLKIYEAWMTSCELEIRFATSHIMDIIIDEAMIPMSDALTRYLLAFDASCATSRVTR